MKLNPAEDTDASGIQDHDRKANQGRQSILSSRRHSRLASDSASSFFRNANSETIYPREFLEDPETGTAGKENEYRSSRHTEGSQGLHQLPMENEHHHRNVIDKYLDEQVVKPREINMESVSEAGRIRRSEDSTLISAKQSRSVSDRLADATASTFHSVSHTLAAVPQSCSPRSKNRESGVVIEERRLMAPIDPPLPRSTTIGVVPNTSSIFTSPYQVSPRTPNFMRPTSSSAARRTQPSKSFKPPPPPLDLLGGAKSDGMLNSFGRHRERKRAQAELGSRRTSQGTHPGLLPGNGSQLTAHNKKTAVLEQPVPLHTTEEVMQAYRKAAKGATPPKLPDPTSSEEADFDHKSPRPFENMCNTDLYPFGPRYASSPELRAAYASEEPPLPKIPQQFIAIRNPDAIRQQFTAAATKEKERVSSEQVSRQALGEPYHAAGRVCLSTVAPHRVSEQSAPSGSNTNKPAKLSSGVSFSNGTNSHQLPRSRIPRSTSQAVGPQQSASELHTSPRGRQRAPVSTSGSPSSLRTLAVTPDVCSYFYENDVDCMNWDREQARFENKSEYSPRKAQRKLKQLYHTNFSSVEPGNGAAGYPGDGMEDFTLVYEAQDLRYWAGRFTANNDRLRNDTLDASVTCWAHQDAARHNKVLQYLQDKCTSKEAEESLAALVRAWRGGWNGGVSEACQTKGNVAPRQPPTPEKKKGLMGKVFGRKKSE
ncbi:MAG: hypothetical protein Q9216_000715 [Gyalolechia sp. 2 TL-2023]